MKTCSECGQIIPEKPFRFAPGTKVRSLIGHLNFGIVTTNNAPDDLALEIADFTTGDVDYYDIDDLEEVHGFVHLTHAVREDR